MLPPHARSIEAAFGAAVRLTRTEIGMSQEALADASDLHRTYISQIERGLKSPSLNAMQRIANALRKPLHLLVKQASGEEGAITRSGL